MDKNSSPQNQNYEDNLLGVHSQIGEQLRAFYSSIQDEAIPQRFLTLLEKLDEAERGDNPLNTETEESIHLSSQIGGRHDKY